MNFFSFSYVTQFSCKKKTVIILLTPRYSYFRLHTYQAPCRFIPFSPKCTSKVSRFHLHCKEVAAILSYWIKLQISLEMQQSGNSITSFFTEFINNSNIQASKNGCPFHITRWYCLKLCNSVYKIVCVSNSKKYITQLIRDSRGVIF